MKRQNFAAKAMLLSAGIFLFAHVGPAAAQEAQQADQKPAYTLAEYNAYQACSAETNPTTKIKCLDDFVAKYPSSTLLKYAYQLYFQTYNAQKNNAKVIEYVDKYAAASDAKADVGQRLQALYIRAVAFSLSFKENSPTAAEDSKKARDASQAGLEALAALPKPVNMTADQFAEQKKTPAALFNYTAGYAALSSKDYAGAITSFKQALAANPTDGVTYFRLGVAYLQSTPAQSMDGFWALSRAIALKAPGESQVRDYLRKRMLVYQQPGCDNLIDAQMNEMIQLAGSSPDRPDTYNFPNSADLDKVRSASNIVSVIGDLSGGGDKAKVTWLAVCGSEFPEVVGKIIDIAPGTDSIDFKVFTSGDQDSMEKATEANMDVAVAGQPDAARLEKEDGLKFAGTLVSYDPQPFLLHWDKAKVDPSIIPPEKAKPGEHKPRRIPKKNGV